MLHFKLVRCDSVMDTNAEQKIDVDKILEKVNDYFGFVPKIFQVLSENPVALKVFFDKAEILMTDEALPPLTKEFVSIGAAAALGSSHCLNTHLEVARELGATDKQLLLTIIIGASIAETTALSKSLRVYDEFKEK